MNQQRQKVVNLFLQKLKSIILYPIHLNKIRNGSEDKLLEGPMYVSATCNLRDYIKLIEQSLQTAYKNKMQ